MTDFQNLFDELLSCLNHEFGNKIVSIAYARDIYLILNSLLEYNEIKFQNITIHCDNNKFSIKIFAELTCASIQVFDLEDKDEVIPKIMEILGNKMNLTKSAYKKK